MSTIEDWFKNLAVQFGYPGVFLISLIGASSIIIPIPYMLTIFWLGAYSKSLGIDITLLALVSGLGSAFGEMIGYFLGYATNKFVSDERKKKFGAMLRILTRHRFVAPILIFFFALTPLPDDLLFIPLGIMHYSIWKAFIPAIFGKTIMLYILAYSGLVYNQFILSILGDSGGIITMIGTIILLIIVVTLTWKIDWEKLLLKIEKEAKT